MRGSIFTRSAPVFTCEPDSTKILSTVPEAFDFTATGLIGVTTPVASTSTMMSWRCTVAVWMAAAVLFGLLLQPAAASDEEEGGDGPVHGVDPHSWRPMSASSCALATR